CRLIFPRMTNCFRRCLLVACAALTLAACGNRETKEALRRSTLLAGQKQYQDANDVLIAALRAREAQIKASTGAPADQAAVDAQAKKIQTDSEILKMERAQIPLYLKMNKADLATSVYSDILLGNPGDTIIFDSLKDPDGVVRAGAVRVLGVTDQSGAVE